MLFSISASIGLILSALNRDHMRSLVRLPVLFWGTCLGLVNFGSIYFLVRTLDYRDHMGSSLDSSVVFGINNIGIVCLSVLLGRIIFLEKLSFMNLAGVIICLAATAILAMAT
jgi:hypothetical protein